MSRSSYLFSVSNALGELCTLQDSAGYSNCGIAILWFSVQNRTPAGVGGNVFHISRLANSLLGSVPSCAPLPSYALKAFLLLVLRR